MSVAALIRARLLVASASLLASGCGTVPAEVRGQTWYWLGTQAFPSSVAARDPSHYTLQFTEDRAALRADCNRGSGSYARKGETISFGPMALTRAFCRPPSLGDPYTRQLQSADRLRVQDGVMWIDLKAAEGTMFFARDPGLRLTSYRCGGSKMLSAVFSADQAQVWFTERYYKLSRERSASGARYSDGSAVFDTKGSLGSLRKGETVLARDCQAPSIEAR